jgi:hypothetical protein
LQIIKQQERVEEETKIQAILYILITEIMRSTLEYHQNSVYLHAFLQEIMGNFRFYAMHKHAIISACTPDV